MERRCPGGGAASPPPKGRPAVLELVRRLKADAARTQQRLEDLLLAMEVGAPASPVADSPNLSYYDRCCYCDDYDYDYDHRRHHPPATQQLYL